MTRPAPGRVTAGDESGTSTLEFALVLPLVLTLALALVQMGLLMKDELLVAGAARAAAREASVSLDPARVRDAAANAGGLDPARVRVEVVRDGGAGDAVSVTVRYSASVAVPLTAWLFPAGVELSARATMRQEVDATSG